MPRIPRIRKTAFPDPMFMNRKTGRLSRFDLFPDEWDRIHPDYVPVQGPDLPYVIEQRRQGIRDAQEAYERDLAEDLYRQAYNRKVAAWNEYVGMSPEERKFWANRGKLEDAMMDYKLDMDPSWYTKNYENFTYLPLTPTPDYNSATRRSLNIHDYPSYDDFDEFPDELSDAPWRH